MVNHTNIRVYRNADIKRVIAYIPPGHVHTRILIETKDGIVIVFQEATIAGILRAYVNVAFHPQRRAIELVSKTLKPIEKKHGFTKNQLIETNRNEQEILEEVENIIDYKEKS